MRITAIAQFQHQIAGLSKQVETIQSLQQQVTTGKKIIHASDNPLLAGRIDEINDEVAFLKGFELNASLAENRTQLMDTQVESAINLMNRAQELLLTAENEPTNQDGRVVIGSELSALLKNLLDIASTQDDKKNYIFSGMDAQRPPFALDETGYHYQGSDTATYIQIAHNKLVPYNEKGSVLFGGSVTTPKTLFDSLTEVVNALNKPVETAEDKALLQNVLRKNGDELTQGLLQLTAYLAEIGNRGNTIQNTIDQTKQLIVDKTIGLSRLADIDMGEAISNLTQRLTTLDIMQQSYLKIQDTFNHLGIAR